MKNTITIELTISEANLLSLAVTSAIRNDPWWNANRRARLSRIERELMDKVLTESEQREGGAS